MTVSNVTIDSVRGLATIDITTAGQLLGISRNSAYLAAKAGQIPTIKLGSRVLVPVPELLRMLGER